MKNSLIVIAGATLLATIVRGQTATPAGSLIPPSSDIVELSPFVVSTTKDTGYGATNAYTATRIGVPISKTPLSIQVVTSQLMEDQGVRDFQQALRFVSGVSGDSLAVMDAPRVATGAANMTIRGFVPTLSLRNGFRRPGNYIVENAERIEVVKGPASVFFGQAAPGGLINVITRKPSTKAESSIDYTYGSYDFNKVRLDSTGPLGESGLAYRFFSSFQDSGDWRDYVGAKNLVVAPSLSWKPVQRLSISLDYEYADTKRNEPPYTAIGNYQFIHDYENPPAEALALLGLTVDQVRNRWRNAINTWITDRLAFSGVQPYRITDYITDISPRGLKFNAGGPEQTFQRTTHNVNLEAIFDLNDHVTFRYGGAYYKLSRWDLRSGLAVAFADRTINLALGGEDQDDEWWFHQFDTLLRYDLPWVKNKLVLGYQYTRNRDIERSITFDPAGTPGGSATILFHNAYTMPPLMMSQVPRTVTTPASDANRLNSTKGYAASWYAEWFQGGRLTTQIGVRREEDTRKRLGMPVLADLYRTATTPTYGATYQLREGLSAYASYSENFAPNSVRSAFGPGLLASDNAVDLPVELGKGYDVGLKFDLPKHHFYGSLALYEVNRTNVPKTDSPREVADPRNINGLSTPTSVRYNVAGGHERSRGMELDLVYAPRTNYQILLSGSWMWEAKIVADPSVLPGTVVYDRTFNQGRRLRNAPEYTLAAWNKYDVASGPLKGLSFGLGVRYMSEGEPRNTDITSSMVNPAFTTVNALIAYRTKISGYGVTFALNADNLFDKLYYEGNTSASDPRKIFFKTGIAF